MVGLNFDTCHKQMLRSPDVVQHIVYDIWPRSTHSVDEKRFADVQQGNTRVARQISRYCLPEKVLLR